MIKRDYTRFKRYVENLTDDVYAQPPDPGHTDWAEAAAGWYIRWIDDHGGLGDDPPEQPPTDLFARERINFSLLDIGCGQGFMCPFFERAGFTWRGVTIGEDYEIASEKYPGKVDEADMSFLTYPDESIDYLFARHVLEHSPFPVITLMEWRRIAGGGLCLVAPAPEHWLSAGKNHYSVAGREQLEWWLRRAGWQVVGLDTFHNRSPLFLKHLKVYQDALRDYRKGEADADPVQMLRNYPRGPVEYRFICIPGEEVLE